jgi:glycerol kinase
MPLHNAIVWHDNRTKDLVNKFTKEKLNGNPEGLKEKCGLPISTYFSALKFKWIMENCEEVKIRVKNGDLDNLCFGTIDSWIIFVRRFLFFSFFFFLSLSF